MCAPGVREKVCAELKHYRSAGGRTSLAGAGQAGAPGEGSGHAHPTSGPDERLLRYSRMVDLTHVSTPGTAVFPFFSAMHVRQVRSLETDGFYANELTLNEHTGTHLDAPAHFCMGRTAEEIPIERFIAPLCVVSIAERVQRDEDTGLTVDDVLAWEKRNGRLPQGAVVAMHSGWESRFQDAARFLNMDAGGTMHFPSVTGEVAQFLVGERSIHGVAVDTLSLDRGAASIPEAHLALLGADKYGLENVASLGTLPESGATIVIGGPKHQHASGGPCRVFALV